ncbi:MAG: hypothetical protein Q8M98_06590 [Candidatus Cloacimonadaceae bacterium]|nr:hypothetical protein [Candidatus Cloacimonadaceae bacterium]MDP3114428.1 hypothetical protein [Candidatus Cloacimonadaceae bacterium]
MKVILAITALILMLTPLMAQINMPRPGFSPYGNNGSSLLNLNRLSMRHSMGFEAGTSSAGDGYYLSRYTNHLKYQFSPRLELDLDLNFVNFGTASNSFKINDDNSNKVIPEFSLRYKPSDSVLIQFEFKQNTGIMRPRSWIDR